MELLRGYMTICNPPQSLPDGRQAGPFSKGGLKVVRTLAKGTCNSKSFKKGKRITDYFGL